MFVSKVEISLFIFRVWGLNFVDLENENVLDLEVLDFWNVRKSIVHSATKNTLGDIHLFSSFFFSIYFPVWFKVYILTFVKKPSLMVVKHIFNVLE